MCLILHFFSHLDCRGFGPLSISATSCMRQWKDSGYYSWICSIKSVGCFIIVTCCCCGSLTVDCLTNKLCLQRFNHNTITHSAQQHHSSYCSAHTHTPAGKHSLIEPQWPHSCLLFKETCLCVRAEEATTHTRILSPQMCSINQSGNSQLSIFAWQPFTQWAIIQTHFIQTY